MSEAAKFFREVPQRCGGRATSVRTPVPDQSRTWTGIPATLESVEGLKNLTAISGDFYCSKIPPWRA